MVDNNTADDNQVVWVDVTAWNGTTLTQLAGIYITRTQFNFPNTYQTFSVPFYLDSAHAGQQIQYRVLWLGPSYVKEKSLDYDTDTIWSQTFGFDPFGNLTKSGSVSFQPGYNTATNRMSSLPGFTPTYDANGNTTSDSLHTYAWDADGHAVTIASTALTYDALGRMVEQNVSGSYTQVLYGPSGGKLALMNGQAVTKAFIPLPAGATAVYTSGPTLSYFRHPDWLGSSRFASTASRTMYYSGAYAPFGENYAESSSDRSFTGQNQDTVPGSTTGLYDFMYREYAQYGRWVSPDPAGVAAVNPANPQSWNRYAYVANIPMTATDPLGLVIKPLPSLPGNISIRTQTVFDRYCGMIYMDGLPYDLGGTMSWCSDELFYDRLVWECEHKGNCYDSGVKLVAASQTPLEQKQSQALTGCVKDLYDIELRTFVPIEPGSNGYFLGVDAKGTYISVETDVTNPRFSLKLLGGAGRAPLSTSPNQMNYVASDIPANFNAPGLIQPTQIHELAHTLGMISWGSMYGSSEGSANLLMNCVNSKR